MHSKPFIGVNVVRTSSLTFRIVIIECVSSVYFNLKFSDKPDVYMTLYNTL